MKKNLLKALVAVVTLFISYVIGDKVGKYVENSDTMTEEKQTVLLGITLAGCFCIGRIGGHIIKRM